MTARQANRRTDLARIHILAGELGLSREAYEDLLFALTRQRSAGNLDYSGRAQVIAHMDALAKTYRDAWLARCSPERQPMLRKIMAIAGKRGKRYVEGISKQMFRVERIEFCDSAQLHKIIAAMVRDQQRRATKETS